MPRVPSITSVIIMGDVIPLAEIETLSDVKQSTRYARRYAYRRFISQVTPLGEAPGTFDVARVDVYRDAFEALQSNDRAHVRAILHAALRIASARSRGRDARLNVDHSMWVFLRRRNRGRPRLPEEVHRFPGSDRFEEWLKASGVRSPEKVVRLLLRRLRQPLRRRLRLHRRDVSRRVPARPDPLRRGLRRHRQRRGELRQLWQRVFRPRELRSRHLRVRQRPPRAQRHAGRRHRRRARRPNG